MDQDGRTFGRVQRQVAQHPLINELLTNGYFLLTPESLQEYLLITTNDYSESYREKVHTANMNLLQKVPPRPLDYDDGELNQLVTA